MMLTGIYPLDARRAPGAFESVTVGSAAAVGLNAYKPTAGPYAGRMAQQAIVTVETADIRIRTDGGNPTASLGHKIAANGSLVLVGEQEIVQFRAIAISSDATLMVTYYY